FDFHLHHVTRLQVARRIPFAYCFADRSTTDRASGDHVARRDAAILRGTLEHRPERVVHVPGVAVHPDHAVDADRALYVQGAIAVIGGHFVARDDPWTK